MKALIITLLMCASALADEPGNGAVCINITGFTYKLKEDTKLFKGTVVTLDGIQTLRFLAYVNEKIGARTDYRAESLIIEVLSIIQPGAKVAMVSHGCVDNEFFFLTPSAFIAAYRATLKNKPQKYRFEPERPATPEGT